MKKVLLGKATKTSQTFKDRLLNIIKKLSTTFGIICSSQFICSEKEKTGEFIVLFFFFSLTVVVKITISFILQLHRS